MENEVGGACGMHGRGKKRVQGFGGKPEGKRPLERPRHRWEDGIKMDLGWGVCGVDSPGSSYGSLAGSCECGDEPSASGTMELLSSLKVYNKYQLLIIIKTFPLLSLIFSCIHTFIVLIYRSDTSYTYP
jgi:hypothetical protein